MSEISREIFRLGEFRRLKLVSTTRVVDEVIHKILLIRAKEKFGIMTKTVKKLRKDKEKVKQLSEDIKIIYNFIQTVRLEIKEVRYEDLQQIPDMMKSYGLWGNDALILIIMNRYDIKYLLSSDADFKDIDWLSLIQITPEL